MFNHNVIHKRVEQKLNPLVFQKLCKLEGKDPWRIMRNIARTCRLLRFSVLPFVRKRIKAVFYRFTQKLLSHTEYYLLTASVTHRHKEVYKPRSCKSAYIYSLFNKKNLFHTVTPCRHRRRNTCDTSARNYKVIFFLNGDLPC